MRSNAMAARKTLLQIPAELWGCLRRRGWRRLTPKAVIELIAPHTWSASILPVVLASALSIAINGLFSAPLFFSLLCTSVCLQCAVNALNDYSDFVSGVDLPENCDDPSDASLLYNDYNPVLAFAIGGAFILAAFVCGLYAIVTVGPPLILFGAVGAAVIFLYSYGLLPVSYTPLGEFASGFVMGGVIPLACFYAYGGGLSFAMILYSLPLIITIGLIMMTNNTCDIERDLACGRRTFPGRIGREVARKAHGVLYAVAVAAALAVVGVRFPGGLWLAPLLLALTVPVEYRLLKTAMEPARRMHAMAASTTLNVRLPLLYALMIAFDRLEVFAAPTSTWLFK